MPTLDLGTTSSSPTSSATTSTSGISASGSTRRSPRRSSVASASTTSATALGRSSRRSTPSNDVREWLGHADIDATAVNLHYVPEVDAAEKGQPEGLA